MGRIITDTITGRLWVREQRRNLLSPALRICPRSRRPIWRLLVPCSAWLGHSPELSPRIVRRLHLSLDDQHWQHRCFQFYRIARHVCFAIVIYHFDLLYVCQEVEERAPFALQI